MNACMHIHRRSVVLSAGHQTQQHGSSVTFRPSAPSHSACASVRQRCSVRAAASHIIRMNFRRCRSHGRGQFGSILGALQCILHVSRMRIAVLTAPFHNACSILLRCIVAWLQFCVIRCSRTRTSSSRPRTTALYGCGRRPCGLPASTCLAGRDDPCPVARPPQSARVQVSPVAEPHIRLLI